MKLTRAECIYMLEKAGMSVEQENVALNTYRDRIVNYDFESDKRKLRADNVRKYFRERELKRLRRNELIASLERGEHLSREELRELSAMGYTT